jgi:hypothetical protein
MRGVFPRFRVVMAWMDRLIACGVQRLDAEEETLRQANPATSQCCSKGSWLPRCGAACGFWAALLPQSLIAMPNAQDLRGNATFLARRSAPPRAPGSSRQAAPP